MNNKEKAIKGGKWVSISTGVTTILQFLQISIVARLLEPASFGVVSISSMIIVFFTMFSNLGFNNSIISKQEEDRKVLSSLYFLNIFLGVIIFAIIYISSPVIASFYDAPDLSSIVKIASLFFLIVYFGQIYSILMQKEMRFKALSIIEIITTVIGTAATVLLAYNGYQEYSLIYGQLIMQIVKTISQIYFGRDLFKPQFHFKFREIKDHLQFGIYNLGDGIVGFVQSNSDNLLVGKLLGMKMLGYYTLALQLAVFPLKRLNPIILQVVYPILSKIKEDKAGVKRAYLQILDFISFFNIPILAGLFITADSIVPLFYGPGWDPTVQLIQIFVLASFCMYLAHPLFTLVFPNGKPEWLFYLNIVTLLIKIPLILILGKYALAEGIAFALVATSLINLILNFFIVRFFIGDFMGTFMKNIAKPLLFSGAMMLGISLYKTLLGYEGILNTILQVCIGGAIFISLTLAFKISLTEIKSFRKAI